MGKNKKKKKEQMKDTLLKVAARHAGTFVDSLFSVSSESFEEVNNKTIENSIIGRLDKIISEEEVSGTTSDQIKIVPFKVTLNDIPTILNIHNISSKTETNKRHLTKVVPVLMKDAKRIFEDYMPEELISSIDESTFGMVYSKAFKGKWEAINTPFEDDDVLTIPNVLFAPNVVFRRDPKYSFDILVVSLPSPKIILEKKTGEDTMSDKDFIANKIVEYILTAIIKCGVKNPIVDTFSFKWARKNSQEMASAWKNGISLSKPISSIERIIFSTKYEFEYVQMNGSLNGADDLFTVDGMKKAFDKVVKQIKNVDKEGLFDE